MSQGSEIQETWKSGGEKPNLDENRILTLSASHQTGEETTSRDVSSICTCQQTSSGNNTGSCEVGKGEDSRQRTSVLCHFLLHPDWTVCECGSRQRCKVSAVRLSFRPQTTVFNVNEAHGSAVLHQTHTSSCSW